MPTKADYGPNLSTAEEIMVEYINLTMTREQVLARLEADLQAAIAVELATIPIYLYTYYSILRTPSGEDTADLSAEQIYANQAGATIMSVAVEEMLHMSLSSNIYYSLTGKPPVLYMNAPAQYPTMLPHHNPIGPPGPKGGTDTHIPLRGFSFEQLWHFLQIEYPMFPTEQILSRPPEFVEKSGLEGLWEYLHQHGWPSDENWNSIGQFYSYIRCLIASRFITDDDFSQPGTQIQGYNYYPNNIDTVYAKESYNQTLTPSGEQTYPNQGKPVKMKSAAQVAEYENEGDSYTNPDDGDDSADDELFPITCKSDAYAALETICEQGEGYSTPGGTEEKTDDPSSDEEESHFYKFLSLQAQFAQYADTKETLPYWMQGELPGPGPGAYTVESLANAGALAKFPDNPVSAKYPAELAALNDFNSGLFQYMLILSETLYLVEEGTLDPEGKIPNQKYFFNQALHRSMIWVMDKWIQTMRGITINTDGPYAGFALAPTFENLNLGPREGSFEALKVLGHKAIAASEALNLGDYVRKYVEKAISLMEGGHSMHLPDVKQYWDGDTPKAPQTPVWTPPSKG